jgi:hypothetical protein
MSHAYQQAGVEPSLDEVLADPIVRLVLRRDRIEVRDLVQYLDEARDRLRSCGDEIRSRTNAAPRDIASNRDLCVQA